MNAQEYLAQQRSPLSGEQLMQFTTFGSSTAACVALMSSTALHGLPADDPRIRRVESCARKVLKAVAELLSACGLEPIPPSPESLGMKTHNGIPVVLGRVIGPNRDYPGDWIIGAYCPYCRDWHMHGWRGDDDPTARQHRCAHCHFWPPTVETEGESPLRETGYFVELDEESQRIIKEKGTDCARNR